MEETIKGIEVIAYKGMKSDMTCRGFKYEIGKTYKTNKVKLCHWGFHACLNPRDVFKYYLQEERSRYFKVKLSGKITKCDEFDTKVAATEITILEEITGTFDEIIKSTEWWKTDNVLGLLYWSDGFAKVQRDDGLYNFIDKNGNYLFNEWFYWLDTFHQGFAIVLRKDMLYTFIDKNGNNLSKQWFNEVYPFYEGFAIVKREDMLYNFIDKNGNYLSKEWFKELHEFINGFAKVQRTNDEWVKIDKTGKLHF